MVAANEAAMELIENMKTRTTLEQTLMGMLERKEEKKKIMGGFGHAIYSEFDPRNDIIKEWSEKLAKEFGDSRLYDVSVRCERSDVAREEVVPKCETSSMPRRITTWAFQPNYLRDFRHVACDVAGLHT